MDSQAQIVCDSGIINISVGCVSGGVVLRSIHYTDALGIRVEAKSLNYHWGWTPTSREDGVLI